MSVPSSSATARVCIRPAATRDAARIAELCGHLGYPSTSEEVAQRLRRLSDDPQHATYIAERCDGQDVGMLIGWLHVEERHLIEVDLRAEVTALIVAEEYRRSGAGRLLMEQAEVWAASRGCGMMVLRSNVIRADAHAFYEKLGYENFKSQKVYRKAL